MSRLPRNGGIVGPINTPTTSAASGIWSLAGAQEAQAKGIWPGLYPQAPLVSHDLVAWYDFADSACFSSGSVTISNLSGDTSYNLRKGDGVTSTTYPSVVANGASVDGGDYISIASNTTGIQAWHKANAAFTWFFALYINTLSTYNYLMSTGAGSSDIGMGFYINSSGALVLRANDGSFPPSLDVTTGGALSTGAWNFFGLSLDETGNGFFRDENGALPVGGSDTFSAAYTAPSASSATDNLHVLADNGNNVLPSGGILGFLALYDAALSATELDLLITQYKSRIG